MPTPQNAPRLSKDCRYCRYSTKKDGESLYCTVSGNDVLAKAQRRPWDWLAVLIGACGKSGRLFKERPEAWLGY